MLMAMKNKISIFNSTLWLIIVLRHINFPVMQQYNFITNVKLY